MKKYETENNPVLMFLDEVGQSGIENQLTDFHVAGAKGFCPRVCVFGSNFKDKITITISQYVKDDSFVSFFAERLRQDNVPFEQSQLDLHGNMNYKLNL